MKKILYHIYLSDFPNDPIKGEFLSKKEARKAAQLYIKQWKLPAKILKIDKATGA